jgi:hypothetical protein
MNAIKCLDCGKAFNKHAEFTDGKMSEKWVDDPDDDSIIMCAGCGKFFNFLGGALKRIDIHSLDQETKDMLLQLRARHNVAKFIGLTGH